MIERTLRFALLTAAIIAVPLLSEPRIAVAAGLTFTVDSALDQIDDDVATPGTCHTAAGTCTLRAAIMEANRTSGFGATILLPAGVYPLTISASRDDPETDGDLNLTTPVSGNPVIRIVGAGAASTIIDANQLDRVLSIAIDRTATISGVTIRHGYSEDDYGGGIYNDGSVTLSNATISDNEAYFGGGIWSTHTFIAIESTISHNTAFSSGGGIWATGDVELRNSTVDHNVADTGGGGIYLGGGLTAVNATISHNESDWFGGGIWNSGTANVYNTTIAFNGADADGDGFGYGGGLYNNTGAVFNLRNTLVAGNVTSEPSPSSFFDDCVGTLTGYGENLFEAVVLGCTINGAWGYFDGLDKLGPLQDNGGPTWTHALLAGSNAIDGTSGEGCVDENSVPIPTDQRGAPRIAGPRCDIGAFEVPEPRATAAVAAAIATLASLRRSTHRTGAPQ